MFDGQGTFRGMVILAATANKEKHDIKFESVSRPKTLLKTSKLIKEKGTSIVSYD